MWDTWTKDGPIETVRRTRMAHVGCRDVRKFDMIVYPELRPSDNLEALCRDKCTLLGLQILLLTDLGALSVGGAASAPIHSRPDTRRKSGPDTSFGAAYRLHKAKHTKY